MSTRIVLILGAGPRIGAAVSENFSAQGYKVALASRKGTDSKTDKGYLSLKADFSRPDSIPTLFNTVKTEFGSSPSVVIYNAATFTPPPDKDSALSIPAESIVSDLNVNTISPYVAAQQALQGWETLPKDLKKSFIYTGNASNSTILPLPLTMNLGIGKCASSYWIGLADTMYSTQGYRFFYADERQEDGKIKGMALDGPAHGDFYLRLANHEGDIPWQATFVKGKGYVSFK